MKVVCLKSIRRRRSPYERMPYYPRSRERYVDEPLWDTIRFPIVPYRPWVLLVDEQGRKTSVDRGPPSEDLQDTLDEQVSFPSYHDQPEETFPASMPPSESAQTVVRDHGHPIQTQVPFSHMRTEDSQSLQQHTSAPPRLLSRPFGYDDSAHLSIPSWKPPVALRVDPSGNGSTSGHSSAPPPQASVGSNKTRSQSVTSTSATSNNVRSQSVSSTQHKLRKYDKVMHTFRSEGGIIDEPPHMPEAEEFDVYLHQGDDGNLVWYASSDGSWVPAAFDMPHPEYPEYTLYLANDKWARWLLKKTVTTYKGRKVHELQSMPRSSANGS